MLYLIVSAGCTEYLIIFRLSQSFVEVDPLGKSPHLVQDLSLHLWLQSSCTDRAKACHRYEEKQGFHCIQRQALHMHHTTLLYLSQAQKLRQFSCAHYIYDAIMCTHGSQHNSLMHTHPRSAHTHTPCLGKHSRTLFGEIVHILLGS